MISDDPLICCPDIPSENRKRAIRIGRRRHVVDYELRDALLEQINVLGPGAHYVYYGMDTPGGILLHQILITEIDEFCEAFRLVRMEDVVPVVLPA